MSTRRARIKAVASLPVRRKNVDNQLKEEKVTKSPRTPRPAASNTQDEITKLSTPATKPVFPTQNQTKSVNEVLKPPELFSPPPKALTPNENIATPKNSEKIPVIASAISFASPLRRNSPLRRPIPSPVRNLYHKSVSNVNEEAIAKINSLDKTKNNNALEQVSNEFVEKIKDKITDKSAPPEDYNPPSIPESITDETGMDGIVPLQPTRSAPKPLDLLKNEIISENAQVLFDPIVPLPSPSKVRPKLRPIPRLAPLRRNSVQGSASESEDESRRALLSSGAPTPVPARQRHDSHTSHSTMYSLPNREVSRIRNDSVCSSVSQAAALPTAASPLKERHVTKCRRQEMSRRLAAMRRRRDPVKRDALTMYDLIFYNPTTNPIVPDQDEVKAKEANLKDEAERKKAVEEEKEDEDDPPAEAAPVPQIKLGPNGEIMLDEQSLVIKRSENRKLSTSVIREGAWGGSGGRYSRAARTADWSEAETVRFYRALAAVGTDFTLMAPLFPDRTRRDLKIKFKKEEKLNGAQVDKALRSQTAWDADGLEDVFARERAAAAERAAAEREALATARRAQRDRARAAQHARIRQSRGAKALELSAMPPAPPFNEPTTADDFIKRALEAKPRQKRKAPKTSSPIPSTIITPVLPPPSANSPYATLTLLKHLPLNNPNETQRAEQRPANPQVSRNIEAGSLVVLTVNDPKSPTKKMLQTYISKGAGQLTPVALPPNLLNSVMGYMKKGTPKSTTGSPQLMSPNSVAIVENRTGANSATSVIQINPSPVKRQRHSSYTITQL